MKPFQRLQPRISSAASLVNRPRLSAFTKQTRRNNATAASILQNTEKPGNSFTQDLITYNHPTAPLASFNQRLAKRLRTPGNARRVRDHVLEIVQEIRQRNLKLDLNTYNALLVAHTRVSDAKAILATLNEMEAEGIQPSLDSYNTMLEALGSAGDIVHQNEILEMMKRNGVVPSVSTYAQLLRGFCQLDMLETALDVLDGMKKAGVAPNPTCYSAVIGSCLRLNECQMAFDLLKEAESSSMAVESEPSIYLDVMRAAAFDDKFDMAMYCWQKAIHTFNLRPDEGTCLSMLRLAGKNADPKLATDIIRQLSTSGYPYKEPYFTPLLEAFVAKKDIKSAFNVLDIMRVSGVQPNVRSTLSIKRYLGTDLDRIDNAYYILEDLRRDGKTVDVAAFNVVIDACATANDLKRTVATYREAKNLGVTPDVETYNAVLGACIVDAVKGMGTVILDEMKEAGVAPNAETYSRMVALCCTQRNYEDAFNYLEEMKGYGIVPPASCYETLVKKLASENDPRFHIALEEMEGLGYKVTGRLRALWNK